MPRLINCCDMGPDDAPVLDSQAYWVRMPDGTRARDAAGKLLAFKYRENAVEQAARIDFELARQGLRLGARAVPPELHEALFTVPLGTQEPTAVVTRKRKTPCPTP